jgi:hypothetical protein
MGKARGNDRRRPGGFLISPVRVNWSPRRRSQTGGKRRTNRYFSIGRSAGPTAHLAHTGRKPAIFKAMQGGVSYRPSSPGSCGASSAPNYAFLEKSADRQRHAFMRLVCTLIQELRCPETARGDDVEGLPQQRRFPTLSLCDRSAEPVTAMPPFARQALSLRY